MSLYSYPTNGLVSTIAPDHHACILQLHMTSIDVFIRRILSACTSVIVSSYQHSCILHLHPTTSHVCNNCTLPFPMSLAIVSNQQTYHSIKTCAYKHECLIHLQRTSIISVLAISNHLCCLLPLQQARKIVMVVTIALGKPVIKMVMNICSMQIPYSGVNFFVSLHNTP